MIIKGSEFIKRDALGVESLTYFKGDQYIRVPNQPWMNINRGDGAYSFSFFTDFVTSGSAFSPYFSIKNINGGNNLAQDLIWCGTRSNRLESGFWVEGSTNTTNYAIKNAISFYNNTIFHVCGTYNSVRGRIFLYLNGLKVAESDILSTGEISDVELWIAGYPVSGNTLAETFTGSLGYLSFYSKDLNDTEIHSLIKLKGEIPYGIQKDLTAFFPLNKRYISYQDQSKLNSELFEMIL